MDRSHYLLCNFKAFSVEESKRDIKILKENISSTIVPICVLTKNYFYRAICKNISQLISVCI